jgi:D-alanine transaminase
LIVSRVAYVNGRYLPFADAAVHVEDRGYQFADGVYEVIAFFAGRLIDESGHLDRLQRSLAELSITPPMNRACLRHVMRTLIRRNGLVDGTIYMQITRGVSWRDHAFPAGISPSLVMTVRRMRRPSADVVAKGVAVISLPDIRWQRCDIKSVSLLPNVLAKEAVHQAGAYEAWLVDRDGMVTEGASTNAWIVTRGGEIVTRAATNAILNGITRQAVLAAAHEKGLTVVERPFSLAEALGAAEAFLTSSTNFALPIVSIDGKPIGDGKPGAVTLLLRRAYEDSVARQISH